MTFSELLAFVMFAALLVMSPGPNGLLIARSVALSGKPRAMVNIAGFISSFYLHGLISILGLSAIIMKSSEAFLIFKLLGAGYLFYIGVQSLLSAYNASRPNADQSKDSNLKHKKSAEYSKLSSFFEGFLTNALNPKVSLFYLAAFPQFIGQSNSVFYWGLVLVTIHAFMNACWFYIIACIVHKTKETFTNLRFKKYLNYLSGLVFIGFAIKLITSKQTA
jgi:threonine/homoserine/homoserine lactone efflux protein